MRWEQLFADLNSQFAQLEETDLLAELPDRQRHAAGTVTMVQRCAAAIGEAVHVRVRSGVVHVGAMKDVGPDWLLLEVQEATETVLALGAVTAIDGLTTLTHPPLSPVAARFDFRLALRGIARDRAPVMVTVPGAADGRAEPTELTGTIDRVGADFIELAQHPSWEPRRAAAVRSMALLPIAGVESVRAIRAG